MKSANLIAAAVIVACASLAGCDRSGPEPAPSMAAAPASNPAGPQAAEVPESPRNDVAAPAEPEPVQAPAPAAPEPVERAEAPPPPPAPRPTARPAAFVRCQACHAVEAGAGHGIGPNLVGVMGAQVGSRQGYDYSDAMGGSDQTWTPELMDAFLQEPREVIPGTKMLAAPVRDPAERRALIDYLSSLR